MSSDQAPADRNDRGIFIALACALFFFLVLGSANADAPADRHGLVLVRLGALIAAVLSALIAFGLYLGRWRGWFRVVGIALPLGWIVALLAAFERTIGLFGWLL